MFQPKANKILICDDSKAINMMLKATLENELEQEILATETMAEAISECEKHSDDIEFAVLDLNLPDAPQGEVVDAIRKYRIPVIVLTGMINEDIRKKIHDKRVCDYVVKDGQFSIDYVASLIKRLQKNRGIEILVVDDSFTHRRRLNRLLLMHQYTVYEAESASEALKILQSSPSINMMITDQMMPDMMGHELIREIRKKFTKHEFPIIGMSGNNTAVGENLSSKLIKYGANDFMHKDIENEEFFCRVTMNVELYETFNTVRTLSQKDSLTNVYNRRFLNAYGQDVIDRARARDQHQSFCVVCDIDKFKRINDTYGHPQGDKVIRDLANRLNKSFESSLVARIGGEEFVVVGEYDSPSELIKKLNQLRESIEYESENSSGVAYTLSLGICLDENLCLEKMMDKADKALYQAKESGRNKLCISE